MKKSILLMLLISGYAGMAIAQDPQVPDFINEPMLLKRDGGLGRLEKNRGEAESADTYNPFGGNVGTNDYIILQQPKSPVRVGTDAIFIVKLADAEVDPDEVLFLTKVVVSKRDRTLYIHQVWGNTLNYRVQIDFEKVSPGVYKVIPKGLTPGTEYSFVQTAGKAGRSLVYLFGTN